ncbi:MAG TPA: hypothetical protein VNA19_13285 [Pyrinomonadaceae bacterium]|jgi:hypothetical protein|nr:hypothetical protein [Pyrinomonadaceae bacterium]
MIEWLRGMLPSLTWQSALLGGALFLITFAGSLALVSYLLVRIPADYFHESHGREFWVESHPLVRWGGIIVKNIFGLLMVLLGIVMSVPGVPGQGVLTILLGVMLLDFPGKRRLEQKLVGMPRVESAINRLRARFDKPPLVL